MEQCDCLNECGDDSRLRDGRVEECDWRKSRRAELIPAAVSVSRMADNEKAILISFKVMITDTQLRRLHAKLSLEEHL